MKLNLRFKSASSSGTEFKTKSKVDSTIDSDRCRKSASSFLKSSSAGLHIIVTSLLLVCYVQTDAQTKVVQWSGLNVGNYMAEPTTVIGNLKAWDMRMSTGWFEASPARQSINFTDNYMDKATTIRGQRNYWVLANKTTGAGSAYNDSNFVEYKVSPTSGSFNVNLVQVSAVFNGVAGDTSGRMAIYYSIDNDTASFDDPMNLGTASLAMHDGSTMTMPSSINSPIKLQSAGTIAQTRISPHAGDYTFTPNLTINSGQTLTIRVYAWSATAPSKALAIRNMVISDGTPWPPQTLAPTAVDDVTPTRAIVTGDITSDGGTPVIAGGAAWTTLTYYAPGVNDKQGSFSSSVTSGVFSDTMKALSPATMYYVRTYATTMYGTVYGHVASFTTPDSITAKPTVTTTTASNIKSATATTGGNISSNGGGVIVASGVLYSTTLSDTETLKLGSGASVTTENALLGAYSSELTGLAAGTTYYVRAYASNSDSTGYGAIVSFTTPLLDITTATPTNISATMAITGGNITPNGGGTITASGVVASTTPNPELATVGAIITTENATTGSYISNLTGLTGSTTYYVRAYATIGGVTTYASQKSFTTSITPVIVQWNGLIDGSFNDSISRLYGNITAQKFRQSTAWVGPSTSNISNSDNYMSNAAAPKGNRNTWASVAKTSGIGAAYSDSGFVEFKVAPAAGTSLHATLFQVQALMNSSAGDSSGRMAIYYSVDNDANSFANPANIGTGSLAMFTGGTTATGSSVANPMVLGNYNDINGKKGTHAGSYTFHPDIMVNDGQTLTVRVYAWNPKYPAKYINIRNIVIGNTSQWPNQVITTNPVTDLTPTRAISGGNIVSDGGFVINESGFVWSKQTYYAVSKNDKEGSYVTSPTVTSGSFSDTMRNLIPATTYYVRAYGNNANGTSYGSTVTFTTPDSVTAKPTVTTTAITNQGPASATSGGTITNNGGGQIVASGILYSSSLSDTGSLKVGSGASMTAENVKEGSFESFLTGLMPGTVYYVRAYASNSDSTGYGAILSFTTPLLTVVQWNGLIDGGFNDSISRLYGNITAQKFRQSSAWVGPSTSNISNTDNFMSNADAPKGNRNTWASVAKTSGIGAAYSDSGFVEFKVSPTPGNAFRVTLFQVQALMNSSAGDTSGRMAIYYSVDNDANSFGSPASMGTGSLAMFTGGTTTTGSSIANPMELGNYNDITSKRGTHAGSYTFHPNINVNDGQTLTVRVYAWNPKYPAKYINIRNIVIGNPASWPNQEITTHPITSITPTRAISGGNIISDGGFAINESGFVWSKQTYYAVSKNDKEGSYVTSPTVTSGSFSDTMRNLTPATTYYVRAYANNTNGAAYGPTLQFTTLDSITAKPTITTNAITAIKSATATAGGNITNNGGGQIVASGVLYSTTLSDTGSLKIGSGAGMTAENVASGSFESFLAGLAPGTTYYVRAYASNSDSTGYGAIMSFTTPLLDITTLPAINVTSTTATSGGTITPNGGGTVTASGVVVSTVPNPELTTPGVIITEENATTGDYMSDLTGLTPSTTYYVRAYAVIAGDTVYAAQVSFTTEAVLPVKLVTFNAHTAAEGVVVNWVTAVEQNVSGFVVERSQSATGFSAVSGSIKPGSQSYTFIDKTVQGGGYYYRLKTIDNDGSVSYSNIVYVSFSSITNVSLGAYPNPTRGKLNVIHGAAAEGSTITVLTLNGSVYLTNRLKAGNTLTTLDVSRLAAGTYFIVLHDHNKKSMIKFIKQ